MGALSKVLRQSTTGLTYWCPGCDEAHHLVTVGEKAWSWNGDPFRPAFSPSVLVRSGHYAEHFKPGDSCWCTYNAENPDAPSSFSCQVCHAFVGSADGSTPGFIQFLNDCTHALKGQLVPLPEKWARDS